MSLSAIVLVLALAVPALAADAAAGKGWDRLGQIPKTQKVNVHLRDGKTVSGFIYETASDGLMFVQNKQVIKLRREDITQVTKKSRLRAAMWGAIAGAGIGAPIGAAKAGTIVDKNNPSAGDRLGCGLVVGGLFGGIGAAIGAAGGAERTLYRAQ